MDAWSSQEWLGRFRQGDPRAADEVYDRYVRQLLVLARRRLSPKLARRIDADDVVQSAYRSFFVHARDGEYVLARAGDLWRLLVAITLHKLYGQVERHTAQRRSVEREEEVGGREGLESLKREPLALEPEPEEAVALAEQVRLVMDALTADERSVFERRLAGATIEQIARESGRSQRTVRRWLENVRRRLEHRFSQ